MATKKEIELTKDEMKLLHKGMPIDKDEVVITYDYLIDPALPSQSELEEKKSEDTEEEIDELVDFDGSILGNKVPLGYNNNQTISQKKTTDAVVPATRQSGEQGKTGFRVRRVRRLVRHVEPWSVLKIGLVFYLCVWGMSVIAFSMIWGAASDAGTIQKFESFIEQLFALETFEFNTEQIFRIFILGGLVMVVGGTAITVVLVVVFNLISDLMGGIRITVIEEETAVRQRKKPLGQRISIRKNE